ncbi:hypothetical protein [Paenibacillus piri]|nr:hypothetical protein [Paenibacillus piri]
MCQQCRQTVYPLSEEPLHRLVLIKKGLELVWQAVEQGILKEQDEAAD